MDQKGTPGSGAEVASRSPDRTEKGGLEVVSVQTGTAIKHCKGEVS